MSESFYSNSSVPSRRLRGMTSEVWQYSREPQASESSYSGRHRLWYCRYCPFQSTNTTNTRKHLLNEYKIDLTKALSQKKKVPDASKSQINQALVHLIVRHNLPFRCVEWPAMCQLLRLGGLDKAISTHSSVSSHIEKLWLSAKDSIRIRLQSALSIVYIAADVWTSPN